MCNKITIKPKVWHNARTGKSFQTDIACAKIHAVSFPLLFSIRTHPERLLKSIMQQVRFTVSSATNYKTQAQEHKNWKGSSSVSKALSVRKRPKRHVGVHHASAGWMRLTSEVLTNPQTCGFQIQPQDFSTPLTLQTSTSVSSLCSNTTLMRVGWRWELGLHEKADNRIGDSPLEKHDW